MLLYSLGDDTPRPSSAWEIFNSSGFRDAIYGTRAPRPYDQHAGHEYRRRRLLLAHGGTPRRLLRCAITSWLSVIDSGYYRLNFTQCRCRLHSRFAARGGSLRCCLICRTPVEIRAHFIFMRRRFISGIYEDAHLAISLAF